MTIRQRYKRLSIWNKVAFCGSVVSIIGFAILIWQLVTPKATDMPSTALANATTTKSLSDLQKPITAVFHVGRRGLRVAPTATFRDKSRAVVVFSYTTHIETTNNVLSAVAMAGGADEPNYALDSKVISTVLSTLEPLTLAEARLRRKEMEKSIEDELRPLFSRLGLTLDAVAIIEIREI